MDKTHWLKTHWPALSFLVIMFVAVSALIIAEVERGACYPNSLQYWSSEQKVPLFACWEFWLNRYQTILAALIGAAVALTVVFPVFMQLGEMIRQNSANARAVTREIIEDLVAEMRLYLEIRSYIRSIDFYIELIYFDDIDFQINSLDEIVKYSEVDAEKLRNAIAKADTFEGTDPENEVLENRRRFSRMAAQHVLRHYDTIKRVLREAGSATDPRSNLAILSKEISDRAATADKALRILIEDRQGAVRAARIEIRRLEREVRKQ